MRQWFKRLVAATALAVAAGGAGAETAGAAEEDALAPLFEALRNADAGSYEQIEARIWEEWSQSGSPAMDLLLERGREALQAGDTEMAIEHFSALIDHAPDFAEAYNARATAYYQANLYGQSLADIREVLARNPRHFGAIGGLALIFEEIGMREGALAAYRRVQELSPHREGVAEAIARLERELEGESI